MSWLVFTTGNPLFPYLPGLFGSNEWFVTLPGEVPSRRLERLARVLYDVSFACHRVNYQAPMTPFLIPLTLLLAFRSRRPLSRGVLLFFIPYLVVFTFLPQDSRYLVPILPAVCGVASVFVARIVSRRLLLIAAILVALPGFAYLGVRFEREGVPRLTVEQRIVWMDARIPEYPALRLVGEESVYQQDGTSSAGFESGLSPGRKTEVATGHPRRRFGDCVSGPARYPLESDRMNSSEGRLRQFPQGWLGQLRGFSREFYLRYLRPHLATLLPQPPAPGQPIASIPPSSKHPDVVVFPVIDWCSLEQRPHHFVRRLAAAGHRCFYLSTRFGPEQARALPCTPPVWWTRLGGPRSFDIYRQELSGRGQFQVWQSLEQLRQRFQIGSAVALVQHPVWTPLVMLANRRWGWKIVYDCMDDHHAFPGVRTRRGQEQEMARHCDCITASHPLLASRFPGSVLVPNGVDFEHFSRPRVSKSLLHLSHPVIGYHGMIGDWLDVPLLIQAARARPDWTFLLVGPRQGFGWLPLTRFHNVQLLDAVSYRVLPSLVQEFDVGCIPFRPGPLVASTDPVKLYEMLAAGLPVVVSGVAGDWESVHTVIPGSSLVPALEAALAQSNPVRAQDFARRNTWDHRFETFYRAAFPD